MHLWSFLSTRGRGFHTVPKERNTPRRMQLMTKGQLIYNDDQGWKNALIQAQTQILRTRNELTLPLPKISQWSPMGRETCVQKEAAQVYDTSERDPKTQMQETGRARQLRGSEEMNDENRSAFLQSQVAHCHCFLRHTSNDL